MKLLVASATAGLVALSACGPKLPPELGAPTRIQPRLVAFDHAYGNATALTVYVTVDAGAELTLPASCSGKTCTFILPLSNGPHSVLLAVGHEGQRSEATTVTLDPAVPR